MITVEAEEVINYEAICPHCGETAYSEFQDDWDIAENYEYTIEIKCHECDKPYNVDLPCNN